MALSSEGWSRLESDLTLGKTRYSSFSREELKLKFLQQVLIENEYTAVGYCRNTHC